MAGDRSGWRAAKASKQKAEQKKRTAACRQRQRDAAAQHAAAQVAPPESACAAAAAVDMTSASFFPHVVERKGEGTSLLSRCLSAVGRGARPSNFSLHSPVGPNPSAALSWAPPPPLAAHALSLKPAKRFAASLASAYTTAVGRSGALLDCLAEDPPQTHQPLRPLVTAAAASRSTCSIIERRAPRCLACLQLASSSEQ